MSELFLDIETVPDMDAASYELAAKEIESGRLGRDSPEYWKVMRGGLNPIEGKAVLITYQISDGYVRRLAEWELGEAEVLAKFYGVLREMSRGTGDWVSVIGHNILGFDLPFLAHRMVVQKVDSPAKAYNAVMRPTAIDFLQMHLPLNDFQITGLKHDALARAYGLPTKGESGGDTASHYFAKRYERITQYSKNEFIYPQMYKKIRKDGMVSRQALQEAVKWAKDRDSQDKSI